MTQVEALLRDLEAAMAASKHPMAGAISIALQSFAQCLLSDRAIFLDSGSTPAEKRAALSSITAERTALADVIAQARKQKPTEAFESVDQKANQLFNILSTVLKSVMDMQDGVARNIL